ncbi:hypothetical protein [Cytobacillus sp.]|uniref:magnesium chelatase subunit ChlI family protein n=1 Tax=Cytobacillus sp. TaxID=2675269 RepID=UPI0028BD59E3|nr:hypothetical protein [Cytobacillus sp.]
MEKARAKQQERYEALPDITTNAQLTPSLMNQFCPLDSECTKLLQQVYDRFRYSGRSLHKFIKIARTIADLEGEEQIHIHHLKKSLLSRDIEKESTYLGG